MALFDDDFVAEFASDAPKQTVAVVERVKANLSESRDWEEYDLALLTEAFALIIEVIDARLLPFDVDTPPAMEVSEATALPVWDWLREVAQRSTDYVRSARLPELQSRFRAALGKTFSYEFSQGDLDRIQSLLNELRAEVSASTAFEPDHQRRLLKRLERLQSEMHKRVSDLDRFWGVIGEAGVVMRKLGEDSKPFVDRLREIAEIVWQTQARAEELPSGTGLPNINEPPKIDHSA